jgi:hypothetical protein
LKTSIELNDRERAIVQDALVAERLRIVHKRSGTKIEFIRHKLEEEILIMNVVIAKLQRCKR